MHKGLKPKVAKKIKKYSISLPERDLSENFFADFAPS